IVHDLKRFSRVQVQHKMASISLIGEGVKTQSGVAAEFFSVLKDINISMISLGASEVNLGIVLNGKDLDAALTILHNHFFIKDSDSTILSSR
ncbi:MAG: ACT domain-containing protein, partial [Calditrichaeota bacterium]|nr:ACT domain-containing protein [Calditrichota bacterium]